MCQYFLNTCSKPPAIGAPEEVCECCLMDFSLWIYTNAIWTCSIPGSYKQPNYVFHEEVSPFIWIFHLLVLFEDPHFLCWKRQQTTCPCSNPPPTHISIVQIVTCSHLFCSFVSTSLFSHLIIPNIQVLLMLLTLAALPCAFPSSAKSFLRRGDRTALSRQDTEPWV